jgi:hypothetical protein
VIFTRTTITFKAMFVCWLDAETAIFAVIVGCSIFSWATFTEIAMLVSNRNKLLAFFAEFVAFFDGTFDQTGIYICEHSNW